MSVPEFVTAYGCVGQSLRFLPTLLSLWEGAWSEDVLFSAA